ncbi:hypothetical protein OG943_28560 [Amycolatopsis sp. NBC_00345]|uniref:hypothetical protein n=1 Tax=Amycolatopsis sp. NBC_00345 TaxID=2975955 RepID=UPI002E25CF0F
MRGKLTAAAAALALVAGCSSNGAPLPSSAPPPSTSPSAASGSQAPHPITDDGKRFLRTIFESENHVVYPMSDACPTGVAYNDQACGAQVKGLGQAADGVVRVMGDYVPGPETQEIIDNAQTVHKGVETLGNLGCFGLTGTGKPASASDRKELRPTPASTVLVSYLAFQSALSS